MSECVVWGGALTAGGYGNRMPRDDESWLVHRAVWEKAYGRIPSGNEIHHLCGNKACFNLEHLQMIDRTKHRSLHSSGQRNGRAKLTDETATYAMARLLAGERQEDVAAALDVSQGTISKLWLGVTWKHLFEQSIEHNSTP